MTFDDILIKLGEFGRYQKILYFLTVCLPSVTGGAITVTFVFLLGVPNHRYCYGYDQYTNSTDTLQRALTHFMCISTAISIGQLEYPVCLPSATGGAITVTFVFLLGVPNHRCLLPYYTNDTYDIQSELHRSQIDLYIPDTDPDDNTLPYDRCNYYVYDNITDINPNSSRHTEECTKWVYSNDVYGSTFATKMDLVCSERFKVSLARSMLFLGGQIGDIVFGVLSDVFGRKKALCIAVIVMCASTLGLAWAPSYLAFVLITMCIGASGSGVYMTAYVLGMELVGPHKRLYAGIVSSYFYAAGYILSVGVAYLLRDWFWIQLCLSLPIVLYINFWWIVPESPRWLLIKGRNDEADKVIRKAARINKVTLPDKLFDSEVKKEVNSAGLWSLFKHRVLLVRTVILFINWLTVTMTYYGLSLNTANLGGDFYVNFFISGVVEFPAYTLCLVLLDRWGRKKCHCSFMLIGGIACLCTIFSTSFGGKDYQWLTTTLAMIGKLGSAAAFAVIYVLSAELFPTVVRSAGIGASTFCAGLGGIAAPYIADSGVLIGGKFGEALPLVIFGGASVIAGLLSLKLPETLNENLPETIEDGIIFGTSEYKTKSQRSLIVEAPVSDIDVTRL